MFSLNKTEHALVTVYADTPDKSIARIITTNIPDKDLRILTPSEPVTLEKAAQNSVLTLIGIHAPDAPQLSAARALKENRMVVCDIAAFCPEEGLFQSMEILGRGFDLFITAKEAEHENFKKFLINKISSGSRRLSALILEEEYRRVCDALSNAPASMIIFDADKRAVFISDHYFRAYPRIASRLVRGLSVYDAFDMMAREEGLSTDSPIYEKLQRFWYNLEGSTEFTLDNGISYRLKAVNLPSRRGTVLMGQNISGYQNARCELEAQAVRLKEELEKLSRQK